MPTIKSKVSNSFVKQNGPHIIKVLTKSVHINRLTELEHNADDVCSVDINQDGRIIATMDYSGILLLSNIETNSDVYCRQPQSREDGAL